MKKYLLPLCFLLFTACCSQAQNSYSNVYYSVDSFAGSRFLVPVFSPLNDGLYVTSTLSSDTGIMLFKTGLAGQVLFSRLYRKPGVTSLYQPQGYYIYTFSDSLITILGRTGATSLIIKTDLAGNMVSSRQFNIDVFIFDLKEYDGLLYGAGWCRHNSEVSGFFCRMDLNGNVISSHAFLDGEPLRSNVFTCFTKTSDGGFLIIGQHGLSPNHTKMMLVKTDSNLTVQWQRHYDNLNLTHYLNPHQVVQTPDNGYLLLVNTTGNAYTHFVKTDSLGTVTSAKEYTLNGIWGPFLYGLWPMNNGHYITGGHFFLDQGMSVYHPVSFEIDSGGTLVSFHSYPLPPPGDNYFTRSSTYKPGHGLVLTGVSAIVLGYHYNMDVLLTDTLFNSGCGDSTGIPLPNVLTVADSVFAFPMISVSRTSFDITSQFTDTVISIVTDLCVTTGLPEVKEEEERVIYPNPFRDALIINLSRKAATKTNVQVVDIAGRKIHSQEFAASTCTLPSGEWSKGVYIIYIRTELETIVKKAVKQ